MIIEPCVVRLLSEGGAIDIHGSQDPRGKWRFVGVYSSVEILDDGNDAVTVSGVPQCRDLAELLPMGWVSLVPTRVHSDLRQWFRDRYASSVASLPAWRREFHEQRKAHRWRAVFESTPPDQWSEDDVL